MAVRKTTPKAGRPPLIPAHRRSGRISVRITPAERAKISKLAADEGLTDAAFVRRLVATAIAKGSR